MRTRIPELTVEREAAILDAAQRHFAQFGLRKTTMDEIAAAVGLSKAALYYYFATKEELFRRVILREQQAFLDKLARTLATEASPDARLRAWARERLIFFRELLNLSALNHTSWREMSPLFGGLFQDFAAAEQRLLTEILAEGMARGTFAAGDAERGGALILHVFHGIRLRFLRNLDAAGQREADTDGLAAEAEQLMDLLLDGLKTRRAASRRGR